MWQVSYCIRHRGPGFQVRLVHCGNRQTVQSASCSGARVLDLDSRDIETLVLPHTHTHTHTHTELSPEVCKTDVTDAQMCSSMKVFVRVPAPLYTCHIRFNEHEKNTPKMISTVLLSIQLQRCDKKKKSEKTHHFCKGNHAHMLKSQDIRAEYTHLQQWLLTHSPDKHNPSCGH